jgi:hypothetical protein
LYVVRELTRKRVWFAEPWLSSATEEVRRLIVVARQWSECLDKPVRGWMSDKQDAFVQAIASEFPGTPHRYCHNHFLRDVAQPVLDMDRRTQVKMRRKVRGLRAIERRVLEERRQAAAPAPTPPDERPKTEETPRANPSEATAAAPRASSDLGWTSTESSLEATGGPRLRKREGRTRGARSCWGIVRRCGVFLTIARAVHCTRPVYGCVRPYRTSATRWSATCKPKKGGCRGTVEAVGWLY